MKKEEENIKQKDKMKINVLILITSSYGGGAEKLVLEQITQKSNSINYFIATLRKGNIESEFKKYHQYICMDTKFKLSIKTILLLNKYIRKHKIKILHTHLLEADVCGFLIKLLNPKLKLISTRHSSNDPLRKKAFMKLTSNLLSINFNKIIAVSKDVQKFLITQEKIPQNKIKTIYHGTDPRQFKKQKNKQTLKELNLSENNFIIGIVGRLSKEKGHKYLLKAISTLNKKIRNIKLLIVGEGKLLSELKKYARKQGIKQNVLFLGFRKDMPNLYSIMDVFCLPSLFEGLPIVLTEAMSSESIVVCSDIPNNKEIIQNGKDGILFQVKNDKQLAKILYEIYKNPQKYESVKSNAINKVYELFDYKKNLRKIEEVYVECLKR